MATYEEMVNSVIDWSNRDTSVLTVDRIKQCISFAHDEIYRTCRIASMEGRFNYEVIELADAERNTLGIPSNTVEFIQLRKQFVSNISGANEPTADKYVVAEARNDIRSFYGDAVTRYSDYSYSRERDQLLIYPGLKEGDIWELYYYYRFAEPDARVEIVEENLNLLIPITSARFTELQETDSNINNVAVPIFHYDAGRDGSYGTGDLIAFSNGIYEAQKSIPTQADWDGTIGYDMNDYVRFTDSDDNTLIYQAQADITAPGDDDPENDNPTVDTTNWSVSDNFDPNNQDGEDDEEDPDYQFWGEREVGTDEVFFVGELDDNWFREINEKALLFGALHQAFDYLDEQDQSGKYKAKFEQEIAKLNNEEMMRQTRGGNIQTNFYNRLI